MSRAEKVEFIAERIVAEQRRRFGLEPVPFALVAMQDEWRRIAEAALDAIEKLEGEG